jgi:hypothetical protein
MFNLIGGILLKYLNVKTLTVLFIAVSVIIVSIIVYLEFSEKPTEEEKLIIKPTIPITQLLTKTYAELEAEGLVDHIDIVDDRVSTYANQALIFEVLRIRHRGLLDKLMTPGNSWKTKPEFYFTTEIDGMLYESHLVEQHRQVSEILFNTWDSMFQERKVMRTAEQEQETSQVTVNIIERETSGLLGLRTKDVEKDSFTLTYCYRTGRWTGDDFFTDSDGYGYYLGDNFEIWFDIYQTSPANDRLPYWAKVNILGLDPLKDYSETDLDGDGIPVEWEWKWGYDPFTWDDHANLDPDMDSITNLQEYGLEQYFADPFIENIYVEVDNMKNPKLLGKDYVFYEETKHVLTERYAQHNIKAFFDDGWPNSPPNGGGQLLHHYEQLSQDSGMILEYHRNYFPDERKGSFIYCLLGEKGGYQHPAEGNVYDTIFIWTIPFNVFTPINHLERYIGYGVTPTPRGVRAAQAAALLHELGHFGGLVNDYFEGVDNTDYNLGGAAFDILQGSEYRETYGQYRSVMNYAYLYRPDTLDYSHGQNGPPYDFNDWANFHLGGWGGVSPVVEEPYYLSYGEEWEHKTKNLVAKDIDEIETPPVTGYVYDENLTEAFEEQIGDWSANTRWDVEWAVHRLVDEEQYPHYREVKVFVSPKDIESKYHHIWSLYKEGDFDTDGNIAFAHSIPIEILTLEK